MQRPMLDSFSDDERTRLMPRKSVPAPKSSRPAPVAAKPRSNPPPLPPSSRSRVYPPKPTMDDPTQTAFEPHRTASSAPPHMRTAAVMEIPSAPRVPSDLKVITTPSSVPPPPVSGDLPPAVITSSSMKITTAGRPTASWAAALVALGVFAGLVTAVLARGDGDALLHAGAQIVDPSHQAQAAAVMPQPVIPTAVQVVQPQAQAPVSTPPVAKASCAEDQKPVVINDTKGIDLTPKHEEAKHEEAPKPVAVAKPVAPKVVAAPPPVVAKPKVEAVAVAPKPPVSKPAPKVAAQDDSAAAADALAKAQLEAALGH